MRAVKVLVTGRVQGVGFRYFTQLEARKRGITGRASNLRNGQVEVIAQGEADALAEFLQILRQSPLPYGKVTDVSVLELVVDPDLTSFDTH